MGHLSKKESPLCISAYPTQNEKRRPSGTWLILKEKQTIRDRAEILAYFPN